MSRKKKLAGYMDRPIATKNLEDYLVYYSDKKVKVVFSNTLKKYTVQSLFNDKKRYFVPLFQENDGQEVGHFTCLIYKGKNDNGVDLLEYFNSLGGYPHKDVVDFITKNNCELDYLAGGSTLQGKDTNTCARHVAFRIQCASLSLIDYCNLLLGHGSLTPDELVSSIIRFQE